MSALTNLLNTYRHAAVSEREKGTYFEELMLTYLRNEATYRDLYSDVCTYADWAKEQGLDARDAGIDLVAKTHGTNEYHAIQCKFYGENERIEKKDIDSFFTASGKTIFKHRIIVSTTNNWSTHAEDALQDQNPPVSKIDLYDLENSQIDWAKYQPNKAPVLQEKKTLRQHQKSALQAVVSGLKTADRGKLIMACGTGKTFTSLKIAEQVAGEGGRVLFLVPSLSLLSQTLTEWTQESAIPLHSFAVCSDTDVGKKRKVDDDVVQTFTHELRYPATTKPENLASEMAKRHDNQHMSVVFGTYHSIDVISQAQKEYDLADFDLIVCDEAHRTTGATFDGQEESAFVRVHNSDFIRSAKRIYMTATPRIYGDSAKASADKDNVALASMDDEALFGRELYVITFSDAVKLDLLVDYKVIVLAVEETHVNRRIQKLLADGNNQLKVDDAAKIIGCWKALSKQGLSEDLAEDPNPMKRAVAFCQVIEPNHKGKTHKVSSKNIASMFQAVLEEYQKTEEFETVAALQCEAEHVDGSMNASQKEEKLNWLKAEAPDNTCRILSNVRCLSEGVDVPALDAVLFLTPRNSQIDVVQSVGRVMRRAEGKKRGYVILPVVIPAGVEAHEALNDNQTYKVVWQVLQALRSHDDRFDAMINKLDLIGKDNSKMEVIAITDKIQRRQEKKKGLNSKPNAKGKYAIGSEASAQPTQEQFDLQFEIGEIERAIYAKLVQKIGNRHHWEDWANDIAKIARTHIDRITAIIEEPTNTRERAAFDNFAVAIRDDLNDSITDGEIIEMLAQHLITKPVFDALFESYRFTEHNPMSLAMQGVLDALNEHRLDKEADTLQRFYDSVALRASGIDSAIGKQKIVVELYDKFFRNAFPRMKERLGIVYTPVEVVDFIIHSVNDVLKTTFGQTLGSEGVHILDPFTGTGTFVTRLLQSGLITPDQLKKKYKNEIHANELVLLAYYIAAINIEAVYHDIVGGEYVPFEGICLTDTFEMYERDDLVSELLEDNSIRRKRQRKLDIRVIFGNPPYSARQASANDNNANTSYPLLDEKIRTTYAERSTATNKNGLYDSYIRAIRWASDRIGHSGVIGFVTNAGFLEANTADGLRKCLADEFSSIHIFHLRGSIRGKSGDLAKKEGQNIFNIMTGVAISILVKNPKAAKHGRILFHDIGDYLNRPEKLKMIADYKSLEGIPSWKQIVPDKHGDWLNQRDESFDEYIVMGDKKDKLVLSLFENYTRGLETGRDAWCYNYSKEAVSNNMSRMIDFYNDQVQEFWKTNKGIDAKSAISIVDNFIENNPELISWTSSLKQALLKKNQFKFNLKNITKSLYRPFTKQFVYYNGDFNHRTGQMPRIFPNAEASNLVIMVKQRPQKGSGFALMVDCIPELQSDGGTQCFPLYLYDAETGNDISTEFQTQDLFEALGGNESSRKKRDAITNEGLAHFQEAYPGEEITKENIFYYVYGLLHSEEYRSRYADNLSKELPRIPRVKTAEDFWVFSKAGQALADLHLNYETVAKYPATVIGAGNDPEDYYVEKMKYGAKKDLTTLHYNSKITVTGIPLEAYEYVVNGKPALDWIVERQGVSTHKDSGIVNDANDWAIETMGNPKYPLELFLRVITVSLETMKIVRSLPNLY
ncbi:DEAD/DEAH box helicase [Advenella sp. WQ 585]|uniref:DEAD/DEAH box helicase n=1 Tax=Advenella mandrilli TaxID=2800330 RepID=A0ABS1ECB8_9BURK|nr:type ISP restriction/modification enzyme [Advenella mandrilli]MBK1781592.1 DEAD/DEAH box helicase [Advenella mandrilli]